MEYSFINYLWLFIIYAFIGWCIEVIFQAVTKGKFVNRGFLNGPVCPIYGFGMVILLFLLGPLADNILVLFIGSVFLTSTLEFITGFILEKIFNDKWWDYSDKPFNIKGYICLSFSIMWGLGAVFVIHIVHPYIAKFMSIFDNKIGNYLLVLLLLYLIADFIVTILGIIKINKRLRLFEAMSKRLHLYSERIGKAIYKVVAKIMKRADKAQKKIEYSKSQSETTSGKDLETSSLEKRYNNLTKEKSFVHRRLEKAFPNIKSKLDKHDENLK